MDAISRIVQLAISLATLLTLVWGLLKMFQSAAEARAARQEAVMASRNAEAAALLASEHAAGAVAGMQHISENVQKIEIATNSMKDALVAATDKAAGLAGEQRGRQQAADERAKE